MLLGEEDASAWWTRNADIFEHSRFTQRLVVAHQPAVLRVMQQLGFDADTVWAHTDPNWQQKFGQYVIRKGSEIVNRTSNEANVRIALGLCPSVDQLIVPMSML